ncbi:TPA: hypothetical protein ACFP4Y_002257, partial [Neisseria bacilliformis]
MTHTAHDTQRPSEKPKNRLRRLCTALLWLVLILACALIGALCWLAASESGLRFALARLPQLGGVAIDAQNLKGTLWHGFSAGKLTVKTPSADIEIDHPALQWRPQRIFSDGLLHIRNL